MLRSLRSRAASLVAIALVSTALPGAAASASAAAPAAPAPMAALGERTQAWVATAANPAGVTGAISFYSSKLSSELDDRVRYVRQGLLRVMVSVSDRDASLESFVDRSTTWARWYFDNPRFYAAVTPDQFATLLRSPAVMFVEPDVKLTYFTSASTVDIHARSLTGDGTGVWSYDATAGAHGALRSEIPGLSVDQATGAGVTVAITDSGVDRTHRDFSGWDCTPGPYAPCESRILRAVTTEHLIGGDDLGDSLPTTEAASGHGTHVSGIVAGNGYYARDGSDSVATFGGDGVPFGVAPQANLVMTKNGDTLWAGLSSFGLEWQLENAEEYGIRVSSNSWGCVGGCAFSGASATGQLFKDMYNAGIVTVFAAGNDGGTNSGTALSGNAQSPYVLGVAAYEDEDHRLASFSSRGSDNTLPDPATWTPASEPVNGERRPDVGAPGVAIWSARTLTGGAASLQPRVGTSDVIGGGTSGIREYASMGGTSMATPHVAGAAALAFSACPAATPLDFMRAVMATAGKDVLKTTGTALAEPFEVGYGGLEMRAAVDWLLARNCGSSGGGDPTPTPTGTPTATPTPDPTPTEVVGGTNYYFHSASGIGNADGATESTFDTTAPTLTGASTFYDLPANSTAPGAIYDPYWNGTVDERFRRLDLSFWQRAPLGDALEQVEYNVTVWVGSTPYALPTLTAQVPPTIGNATSLIQGTFTTMLDANGDPVPLDIDPAGQPMTFTIGGVYVDSEAGAYIQYDSVTKPAGFTVSSGAVDPDPTATPTPTPTPTSDPTTPPPPSGDRGVYPLTPNDPLFPPDPDLPEILGGQWGMRKILAPEAWQEDQATGYGIKVAVLDTGLDLGHPDLSCPGKVEVIANSDFIGDGNGPQDGNGHGTHVAGIIGACTNNGTGVVGVAPDSTIMPIQVLDAAGSGTVTETLPGAIRAATDAGAHVISMSLGTLEVNTPIDVLTGEVFPEVEEAIEYAIARGVVVVAAAGNSSFPMCSYPAIVEDIVCVGSSDNRDLNSYFGNFPFNDDDEDVIGAGLMAPGGSGGVFCDMSSENILSTIARAQDDCDEGLEGYRGLDGTSMAAPHVSGVAALVYDRLSGERTAENGRKVVEALINSTDDMYAPGWDPMSGYGRLNALQAVRYITVTPVDPMLGTSVAFTGSSVQSGQYGDDATFAAQLLDENGVAIEGAELSFELTGEQGGIQWVATTGADGVASATKKLNSAPGAYNLTVRFAGQEGTFESSSNQSGFVVDKESTVTTLSVTGKGLKRDMTSSLAEDGGPLADRVIVFYANGAEIARGTTDATGVVTLPAPQGYRGDHFLFEARYAGEENFAGSSATSQT